MTGVPESVQALGWWAVFIFLFCVVFLRAQATYWVGRGVRSGALKSRWHERFEGPGIARAQAFLQRWGPWGLPVTFLTVGFQTLVNAAAGFGRMRYPVYTLAMIPGCIAWATMYTLLGRAASELIARFSWYAVGVLVLAAVVGAVAIWLRRSGDSGSNTLQ